METTRPHLLPMPCSSICRTRISCGKTKFIGETSYVCSISACAHARSAMWGFATTGLLPPVGSNASPLKAFRRTLLSLGLDSRRAGGYEFRDSELVGCSDAGDMMLSF